MSVIRVRIGRLHRTFQVHRGLGGRMSVENEQTVTTPRLCQSGRRDRRGSDRWVAIVIYKQEKVGKSSDPAAQQAAH